MLNVLISLIYTSIPAINSACTVPNANNISSPRIPVVISSVQQNPDNPDQVQVQWNVSVSDPQNATIPINDAAIIAIPVDGPAILPSANGIVNGLTGTILQIGTNTSQIQYSGKTTITLKQGIDYHLFATGYVCDLATELSLGSIRWQEWTDSKGQALTTRLTKADPKISLKVNPVSVDPTTPQGLLIQIAFQSLPTNASAFSILADGVEIGRITHWEETSDVGVMLANLGNGGVHSSVLHNSSQWQWVGWFPSLNGAKKITLSQILPNGDLVERMVRSQQAPNYASIEVSRARKALSEELITLSASDIAVAVAGLWLYGDFIDQGATFDKIFSHWISDNPNTPISGSALVNLALTAYSTPQTFGSVLNYENPSEVEVFDNSYTRIDIASKLRNWISSDADLSSGRELDAALASLRDRFLLSWSSANSFFILNDATGKIEQLKNKVVVPGVQSPTLYGDDNQWIILGKKEVLAIMKNGLWARANPNSTAADEFNETPVLAVSDELVVHLSDYPTSQRFSKFVAFIDPRSAVGVEKTGYYWSQSGLFLESGLESKGYMAADKNLVIPVQNSAAFKVAATSLGANGPPGIGLVDWREQLSHDVSTTLQSPDNLDKTKFQLFLNVDPANVAEGLLAQSVVSLKDANLHDRILIPISYWPTGTVHYLIVNGGYDGGGHESNDILSDAYIRYMHQQYHQYVEKIDMRDWHWGEVYFHNTGLSFNQKAAAELGLLANGVPKIASSPTATNVLPIGSLTVLGQSDYTHLSWSSQSDAISQLGGQLDPTQYSFSTLDPKWLNLPKNVIAQVNSPTLCATTTRGASPYCFEPQYVQNLTLQAPTIAKEVTKQVILELVSGDLSNLYYAYSDYKDGAYVWAAVDVVLPAAGKIAHLGEGAKNTLRASHIAEDVRKSEPLLEDARKAWISDIYSFDEIAQLPKGTRPPPTDLFNSDYINKHVELFKKEGGTFITWTDCCSDPLHANFPKRKYVGYTPDMERVIAKYNETLDWTILRDELGLDGVDLSNEEIWAVTIPPQDSRFQFEFPDGNEAGANKKWIPGAKTENGIREAALVGSEKFTHDNIITQSKLESFFGQGNVVTLKHLLP